MLHIIAIIYSMASENLSKNIKQTKFSIPLPQAVLYCQTMADFSFVYESPRVLEENVPHASGPGLKPVKRCVWCG